MQLVEQSLQIEVRQKCFVELGKGFVLVDHILKIERKLIEEGDSLIDEILDALYELGKKHVEECGERDKEDEVCGNDAERTQSFFTELSL